MLSESQVQVYALDFLKKYYRRRARCGKVAVRAEAPTVGRKRGRADGLVVWRHWLTGGIQVASMEAKSRLTRQAIRPQFHFGQWLRNSLLAGVVVCALTGVLTVWYKVEGTWAWLLPLNVCVGSGALYGLLTWRSAGHRRASMMQQLDRYPGNFQWLAIPERVFRQLDEEDRQALLRLCRME
ncbi:MAG: hypothetical protein D6818_08705, partial [Bacteroidetes bacterium]